MSNPSEESQKGKSIEAIQGDAQRLVEEIRQLKVQAEDHLKAAEASRKKADEDATYAFQAKANAESHAKEVASFKGNAESEFNAITANKQKTDEVLAFITASKPTIEGDAVAITASRKDIEKASSEVAEVARKGAIRLQEIDASREAVEAEATEAKALRDTAIQERNKTEAARTEAEQLARNANDLTLKIRAAHEQTVTQSNEIEQLLTGADTDRERVGTLVVQLEKRNQTATTYEAQVTKYETELKALVAKIEGLVSGAASASLASAFASQKKRFRTPRLWWMITFVACVVSLAGIGIPGFAAALKTTTTNLKWDEVLLGIAIRMPIVIPLVWLAIYAGRNYMLGLRLEEDYAYKEAISMAFEGYKREMKEISVGDAANPNPLTILCTNILRAIAERPGRIYEGKPQDITVLTELKTAVEKAEELRKKTVATA